MHGWSHLLSVMRTRNGEDSTNRVSKVDIALLYCNLRRQLWSQGGFPKPDASEQSICWWQSLDTDPSRPVQPIYSDLDCSSFEADLAEDRGLLTHE